MDPDTASTVVITAVTSVALAGSASWWVMPREIREQIRTWFRGMR